jgi:SagB-type dehydrogenase family enzyme
MESNPANSDISRAWDYHNATKHSQWSVHSSRHFLDWANQPIPLKIYTTIDPIALPRNADQTGISALSAISTPGITSETDAIPSLADLARLLFFSAGITKKRSYTGGELYFRAASCTGALYEFELYLVCGNLPDLQAGIYHFNPGDFALRLLRAGDYRGVLADATAREPSVLHAPATVVCTGTYWRNAWKYRTRTYRHFGWDNGTILANMLAMAAASRLPAKVVMGFVDSEVNRLLDLDSEREVAFSMISIGHTADTAPSDKPDTLRLSFPTVPLSQSEVEYPELREIHAASSLASAEEVTEWRNRSLNTQKKPQREFLLRPEISTDSIERVILRRGSTRNFQRASITHEQLMTVLHTSTQGIWPGVPFLNDLYLIINAVDGVDPGAYFYNYETRDIECLKKGDFRSEARFLGLQQDLPGDAAADVFMLADLQPILERLGNRGYRAVQLEAGILGGKMYLASYAQHFGATGLTFFDDDVMNFFSPHSKNKSAIFLVALGKSRKVSSSI